MRTIDLICPVFREEEAVGLFHERLAAVLDGLPDSYRVSIRYVLDPSPDRTEEVLQAIASRDSRVELLVMSRRFGHQAALVAGMDHSTADAVLMLDSDLQHPPELIPALIRRWEDGADIVQAIRQDGSESGLFKRLTSRWFYKTFMKVGAVDLQSGAADYRLLSRRVVEVFRNEIREHNPFLRGLVGWVGFRIDAVPFLPAAREKGQSKYRVSTLLNFAINGICSFSKVPLRMCIGVGFTIAMLSILGGGVEILAYFVGNVSVPGWVSLFAAVSFIGGVQLIFLGVIGEYVSLIFDEVKNRPRYVVARRHQAAAQRGRAEALGDRKPAPATPRAPQGAVPDLTHAT